MMDASNLIGHGAVWRAMVAEMAHFLRATLELPSGPEAPAPKY